MRATTVLSLSLTLLAVACSDTSLKVVATAPTAKLLAPVDGDLFVQGQDTLSFYGQVGDKEQSPETLAVLWLSNVDGVLSDLPADTAGAATFELPAEALSLGAHTITLSVADDDGLNTSDEVGIEILPADAPPTVSITAPSDGAAFDAGTAITFEGLASDARTATTDLYYEWESDEDGVLDAGALSSEGTTSYTTASLAEGEHTILLRVTDTDGYSAEASVTVEVLHVNTAPEAEITAPANGSGLRVGTLATLEGLVSDAEDPATDLATSWSSDLDGELCAGAADSSGSTTCAVDDLSVGLHTITLTVTDSAGDSAYANIALQVYEANSAPGTPEIAITPASPYTADDLTVTVVTAAEDPDGDAVSYNYQWYRDDALMSGYTSATVAAARTTKGEIWKVEVTATDGEDSGTPATAEVEILDSAPSITGVSLSPSSPTTLDTLTCTPSGWSDDDGDVEDYDYQWTVDGLTVAGATGATLAGAFEKDQVVACQATPWDGEVAGDPMTSSAVTIVNSPPEAPVIAIDPAYPVTTDALTVTDVVAASDADGDTLSTTYVWARDGAVVSRYTTGTVPASATSLEEDWTVYAVVDDGDDSATSDPVTVRIWPDEGDLIVTEFMPDPDAVSDQRGEWLEIYNTTDTDISLDDHDVKDLDYDDAALDGYTIAAGAYFVLCVESDPTQNGGVTCDLEVRRPSYGTCSGTDCMLLGNTSDEILIINPVGTVDEVDYTSSWVTAGKSSSLDPRYFDDASNDSKSSWCAASSLLSGGDRGTPGGDNDGC